MLIRTKARRDDVQRLIDTLLDVSEHARADSASDPELATAKIEIWQCQIAGCQNDIDDYDARASDAPQEGDYYTRLFIRAGFLGVHVARMTPPESFLGAYRAYTEFVRAKYDEGIIKKYPYYRVETAQGILGVYIPDYPELDLTSTGLSLKDVRPHVATRMPDWLADVFVIVQIAGSRQLMDVRELMESKSGK